MREALRALFTHFRESQFEWTLPAIDQFRGKERLHGHFVLVMLVDVLTKLTVAETMDKVSHGPTEHAE